MGRAGACWLSPRTDQHRCQTKGWRRGVLECEAQRWLGGLGRHRWVFPPCSRTLCYCCHRQGSPRAEIMATKLQASCPEGHPWKWNWLLCKAQPPFSWEKASVFVSPDASRPAPLHLSSSSRSGLFSEGSRHYNMHSHVCAHTHTHPLPGLTCSAPGHRTWRDCTPLRTWRADTEDTRSPSLPTKRHRPWEFSKGRAVRLLCLRPIQGIVSLQLQPGTEAFGGALRASGPPWCLVQNSDCRNWKESGGACDARTTAARQRGRGPTQESPPATWPVPWSLVQGALWGWGRVAEARGKGPVPERSLEKPEDSEPHLCSPQGGNSPL